MRIKIRSNIRIKLIMSLLSVVIITGIGSIIIGISIINNNILEQAYDQVQNDLKTSQYIYNDRIDKIHIIIKHLSSLLYLQEAVAVNNRTLLLNKLQEVKQELDLDILNIADANGRIIIRARNSKLFNDDVSEDLCVDYVLKYQVAWSGSNIIGRDHLLREGEDLANKSFIRVIPTAKARKRDTLFENRSLALESASPIIYNNRFIGVIYGAKLLNNNFDFVDRIKSLVFKNEKFDGYDIGTATIFLKDLRISTNVTNRDGSRAIGTQVSEEVYNKVFKQGKLWLDKAFVVNNWYISAYSPIFNVDNEVIGILYVGILEEKYDYILRKTIQYFLLVIFLTLIIAIVLSIYLLNTIITPIKVLLNVSKEIAQGNYQKIDNVTYDDEMGYLCLTFNKMIDAIVEKDKKLQEQTEKKIVQSEKLASLGRLASGIAHEINNPLTGVLTFSSLLLEDLRGSDYEDDLKVIVRETLRCREIVRGILEFAKEAKLEKHLFNVNKIIDYSLAILEKHVNFQNIFIKKKFADDIPEISLDINQIESVINNLAVNAADAMSNGGELSITTEYDKENQQIIIEFTDTGIGIPPDIIDKIFDPFFTTKETGKGTGLGLAVTYGIIKRHNGNIEVKSKVGEGSKFIIKLPINS